MNPGRARLLRAAQPQLLIQKGLGELRPARTMIGFSVASRPSKTMEYPSFSSLIEEQLEP